MDKDTRIMMIVGSGIFSVLGWIPIVNIFSNIIWWLIWLFVMLMKGMKYLKNPKIITTSVVTFVLGLIPIVSIIPWGTIGTFMNMRMIRLEEEKKIQAVTQQ